MESTSYMFYHLDILWVLESFPLGQISPELFYEMDTYRQVHNITLLRRTPSYSRFTNIAFKEHKKIALYCSDLCAAWRGLLPISSHEV